MVRIWFGGRVKVGVRNLFLTLTAADPAGIAAAHLQPNHAICEKLQNPWRIEHPKSTPITERVFKAPRPFLARGCVKEALPSLMPSAFVGLFYVTPARLSQIMGLLMLAPDIQEAILMLPKVHEGRDTVTERDLQRITRSLDWGVQRKRNVLKAEIQPSN